MDAAAQSFVAVAFNSLLGTVNPYTPQGYLAHEKQPPPHGGAIGP